MKKIVVIGGGTGTYTILTGLRKYDMDLTAVVSTADSGGSSGVLRTEFGMLPPSDMLRAMVALSDRPSIMKDLMLYRFEEGCSIGGHRFGNLLITALREITGSDEDAFIETAKMLAVRGKVYPVTLDDVQLCAKLEDGRIILGEKNIDAPKHNGKIESIFLKPAGKAYVHAIKSIEEADLIILGPGDLYTSILPNLLVDGIVQAMQNSRILLVCSLTTKHGETDEFLVHDFVNVTERYLKRKIDYIVYNTTPFSEELIAFEGKIPVKCDLSKMDARHIGRDLAKQTDLLRHDPEKIAKFVHDLMQDM